MIIYSMSLSHIIVKINYIIILIKKQAQRRDQGIVNDEGSNEIEELTDVKDLRSNKKKENKEKQIKKKAGEVWILVVILYT